MARVYKKHVTHQLDIRDLLLKGGVGQYNAVMSIPYMNFLPGTTDPYAQGVLQLVKGLQRLLNQGGARLTVDGGLGAETMRALSAYAGPRWYDQTWAQLYGAVIEGRKWQGYAREDRGAHQPVSGWDYRHAELSGNLLGDLVASPLPWIAAAGFVWWKWFRKGAHS